MRHIRHLRSLSFVWPAFSGALALAFLVLFELANPGCGPALPADPVVQIRRRYERKRFRRR